ncbi:transposase [Streptomyces alanosinicus]
MCRRKVRAWLADHPDRIEPHFLPSYSPEPNPDELVNADLKRSLPMHSRARDQAQLAAETRRFFHRRQRQPHIVRGCFDGPHVRCISNRTLAFRISRPLLTVLAGSVDQLCGWAGALHGAAT